VGRLAACVLALCLWTSCTAPAAVDGERLMARIRHQVDAGPRIPGTPGHAAIRDWLIAECQRLGATVEVQQWVDSTTLGRPLPLANVIARFAPASPARAGERPLVLAAHWDTRAFADRDPDSTRRAQPVPGANDGGSGVAVLLEVAELLHERPAALPVELVFFDGEDQGIEGRSATYCIGSRFYAATFTADRDKVRPLVVYVFDMVGDRDLDILPERQSVERAANFAELVVEAARATRARGVRGGEGGPSVYDDHVPLLDAGIPAVDIIDIDYAAWHTTHDLPDQVSTESLVEVGRIAAWLVYRGPWALRR
jgi:glutaminyl-peptide cyclotransferase